MWPTYPKRLTVWPIKGKSSLPPDLDDWAKPAELFQPVGATPVYCRLWEPGRLELEVCYRVSAKEIPDSAFAISINHNTVLWGQTYLPIRNSYLF